MTKIHTQKCRACHPCDTCRLERSSINKCFIVQETYIQINLKEWVIILNDHSSTKHVYGCDKLFPKILLTCTLYFVWLFSLTAVKFNTMVSYEINNIYNNKRVCIHGSDLTVLSWSFQSWCPLLWVNKPWILYLLNVKCVNDRQTII